MDGLDQQRGVIVIGATNRLNAIDPALRRSGRFDRELYFPLPNKEARKQILEVHTKTWGKNQMPDSDFLSYLSSITDGYCGSDLQALCTETVMNCLRRTFPDVKQTGSKIDINTRIMKIEENDFLVARKKTIPTSHYVNSNLIKLSKAVQPLLQRQLDFIMLILNERWPHFSTPGIAKEDIPDDMGVSGRLLLTGTTLQGHSTHMAPALLQALEHLPVHIIDVQTIYRDSSMFAEEICIQKIEMAKCHLPAIVMIYKMDQLLKLMNSNAKEILHTVLRDVHLRLPLLILATTTEELSAEFNEYFNDYNGLVIKMEDPTTQERFLFLNPLATKAILKMNKPPLNEIHMNTKVEVLVHASPDATLPRKRKHSTTSIGETKKLNVESRCRVNQKERGNLTNLKNVTKMSKTSMTPEPVESIKQLYKIKKTEVKSLEFTAFEDCLQYKDNHEPNDFINSVKTLFKRAIFRTSKNMQISQLELFYDVLQNRILRNSNNPKKLIDEIEEILTCFEKMP